MMPARHSRGFTVLELMLVVGIMGILAGMAIGYSGNFRRVQNLKEMGRNVVSTLAQARAEALRRSTKVSAYFGAQTMYAFIDTNGDYQWEPGESIFFQYPPAGQTLQPTTSVTSFNGLVKSNPLSVTTAIFDFQGFSEDYQGNPLSAVVCVKDTQLQDVLAIQLSVSGAVRVTEYSAGAALCP